MSTNYGNENVLASSFQGGMNLDISDYLAPNGVYTYLQNGTFITHNNNELILQNEQGTTYRSSLKENYIPVAVKSYNNVAYILSAEVEYKTVSFKTNKVYESTDTEHKFLLQLAGDYEITFTNDTDLPITININQIIDEVNQPTIYSLVLYPQGSLNSPSHTYTFTLNITNPGQYHIPNLSGLNLKVEIYEFQTKQLIHRFTGRGEIGSFPSPDYANLTPENCDSFGNCDKVGVMTMDYRPFQNYGGDNNSPIISIPTPVEPGYGDFNSVHFNFQEEHLVKIVAIQEVYDGSVNVIFTDFNNPPRMINSRFTVIDNNRVRIVNRKGLNDDNLYKESNWRNSLNQILKSNRLLEVKFSGQSVTGALPNGVYRYYFKYTTQDGNETAIIGNTFDIPVWFGDSVATTRAGAPNEPTNKANIISLNNIDSSYSYIKVYFTYNSGNEGGLMVDKAYEIVTKYPILGNTLTITHTGFEEIKEISKDVLRELYQDIYTYKTGVELKGRLFIANIKSKVRNTIVLEDFAKKITTHHTERYINIPGLATDFNDLYSKISYNTINLDAYSGGYYNPRNVHDYLGYFGGETYAFAVSFIYNDGTESELYPVRGHDFYNGSQPYNMANVTWQSTGENTKGIFRFPKRNHLNVNIGLNVTDNAGIILGVFFNVPNQSPDIDPLIEEGVIGLRFYRSKRKENLITQGMLIDTIPVPINRNRPNASNVHESLAAGSHVLNASSSKVVPAYGGMLETPRSTSVGGGGSYNNLRTETGIEPVYFDFKTWEVASLSTSKPSDLSYWRDKKLALISSDVVINPLQSYNTFISSGNKYKLRFMSKIVSDYYINNNSTKNGTLSTELPIYFSAIKQKSSIIDSFITSYSNSNVEALIDLVYADNSTQTINKFSSSCDFVARCVYTNTNVQDYGDFKLNFNTYLGVTLQDVGLNIAGPVTSPLRDEVIANPNSFTMWDPYFHGGVYGTYVDYPTLTTTHAYLVNVYPENGVRTTAELENLYNPESELYFPISNPLYLNLGIKNQLTNFASCGNYIDYVFNPSEMIMYNGDCYLNFVFHRLFRNSLNKYFDYGATYDNNIIQRQFVHVGYTLAFLSESKYNIAAKTETVIGVNIPELASYNPINTNSNIGDKLGANNSWRERRMKQSEGYNIANSNLPSVRYSLAAKAESIFSKNFSTRIAYSNEYLTEAFANSYRIFPILSFKDYPKTYGQIMAIEALSNSLVVVFENGIAIVPVNERVSSGSNNSTLYFTSLDVLQDPKYLAIQNDLYGTRYLHSVTRANNIVFGVDIDKAKIWAASEGGKFELISDFRVQSLLRSIQDHYEGKSPLFLRRNIQTFYDTLKHRIVFSFRKSEDIIIEEDTTPDCNDVIYNEPLNTLNIPAIEPEITQYSIASFTNSPTIMWSVIENKWLGFISEPALIYFNIKDRIYSFDLIKDQNKIYQHYIGDYQVLYDRDVDFILEYRISNNLRHIIYDNLILISNHVYPYKIEYETEHGKFTQIIRPRNKYTESYISNPINAIPIYDAAYKEDHMYITIAPNQSDTRSLLDYINTRVRGKYCKIRLYYSTKELLFINSTLCLTTNSYV